MTFKHNPNLPPDSIDSRWTEISFSGLPDDTPPSIPPHWHKHHDEYMRILRGRVEFTLDNRTTVISPSSPELLIQRRHVHSFRFLEGEAAMFMERTDPTGGFKADFFEDLLDSGDVNFWTVWRACYRGDTYMAMPGPWRWVDELVTVVFGWLSMMFFPQRNKGLLKKSVAGLNEGVSTQM